MKASISSAATSCPRWKRKKKASEAATAAAGDKATNTPAAVVAAMEANTVEAAVAQAMAPNHTVAAVADTEEVALAPVATVANLTMMREAQATDGDPRPQVVAVAAMVAAVLILLQTTTQVTRVPQWATPHLTLTQASPPQATTHPSSTPHSSQCKLLQQQVEVEAPLQTRSSHRTLTTQ